MSERQRPSCNVVISAAGRRVALLRLFQQALGDLGLIGQVMGTDLGRNSAAMHAVDEAFVVPPYRDPGCEAHLLGLAQQRQWRLFIPTIDPELPWLAERRELFAAAGCTVAVSSPETIAIGRDKQLTHDWLVEHGFPTVRQWSGEEARAVLDEIVLPAIVKPRFGSSSIGLQRVATPEALLAAVAEGDMIVQSRATGVEYTVDVFVDGAGRCTTAVPRLRLETRGGEVSKGVTARVEPVATLARQIAEALPGAFGVLNVQIFHDDEADALHVIEINPRFGGGYPLSDKAGATMARWLVQQAMGLPVTAHDDWQDGLVMLRYDDAVFVSREGAGL